jgi:hypothetical protein
MLPNLYNLSNVDFSHRKLCRYFNYQTDAVRKLQQQTNYVTLFVTKKWTNFYRTFEYQCVFYKGNGKI